MARVSQSAYLRFAAYAIGAMCVLAGVDALVRPHHALSLFHLDAPATAGEQRLAGALMAVVGVRDMFTGTGTLAAARFGSPNALGWALLASCVFAVADGAICWRVVGHGQGGHWGFVPVAGGLGVLLLGALDGR